MFVVGGSMVYQFGNFEVDTINFCLKEGGENIAVEPQVFNLVAYLIVHKDRLILRRELFDEVWRDKEVCDATLSNHIKMARKILGDDGRSQKIIKTIHGRGYQFIADVLVSKSAENLNGEPVSFAPIETTSVDLNEARESFSIHLVYKLILIALCIIIAFYFYNNQLASSANTNQFKKPLLVAVLPFNNTKPNLETDYFAFAIADQIVGNLSYLKGFSVRPSSSVKKYANTEFDSIAVGREMNVEYVLTGSFLNVGKLIRLNIELIEVSTGKLVWRSEQIEANYDNVFQLQDMVAEKISRDLKLEFSIKDEERLEIDVPSSALAYEFYLRSIAQPFSSSGHQLAIELLKKSISIDDKFAPAFVQLGSRIRRYEQYSLINTGEAHDTVTYYQKALSLNPELIEALSQLAFLFTETNRIDKAILLVKRMLEINPNSASTRFTLGYIYRYAGMNDEAISEMLFAVNIDPKNVRFRSLIATYSGNGEFKKALALVNYYNEGNFTNGWKGILNYRLGKNEVALSYFEPLIEADHDGLWGLVATIHRAAILNRKEEGLFAIHRLEQTNITDAETIFYTAAYYGMLKDKVRCIQRLKKAVESGYFNSKIIRLSPHFKFIENEPAFKHILSMADEKNKAFRNRFM